MEEEREQREREMDEERERREREMHAREKRVQWIIKFEETLQRTIQIAPSRYRSIYRVTSGLAEHKKGAYMPSTISLGPYHRSKPMDQDKGQALRRFLFEASMMSFRRLVEAMESVEEQLKEFYEMPDDQWGDPNEFLEMMITDGFFLLSVMCFLAFDNFFFLYERPDIIDDIGLSFKRYWGSYYMAQIRRDILLLENQLPIILLWKLMEALGGKAKDVNRLILNFLNLLQPASESDERPEMVDTFGFHILDVYRRRKISPPSTLVVEEGPPLVGSKGMRWSATELDMAGIQFRKSYNKSFNDITFSYGTLRLPCIDIDDTTETLLLNFMAFEHRHSSANHMDVTCYIHFMGGLISSSSDVVLLKSKGIIHPYGKRSDDDVANLFKMVLEGVGHDIKEIDSKVVQELSDYLKPWYRTWRAMFAHQYFFIVERVSPAWVPNIFKTQWVILTLLVGFFYFGTNILQTVYTILSFYKH